MHRRRVVIAVAPLTMAGLLGLLVAGRLQAGEGADDPLQTFLGWFVPGEPEDELDRMCEACNREAAAAEAAGLPVPMCGSCLCDSGP